MMRKKICTNPFHWCEISPTGEVFLCCPAWLPKSIGNLYNQSIEQIWNSKNAQEIRKSIIEGSFKYCNKPNCPFLVQEGKHLKSISDLNKKEKETLERNITSLKEGPEEVNLCHDPSCNLFCPSCRKEFYVPSDFEVKRREVLQKKIEKEVMSSAKIIKACGMGEPFYSPVIKKMFQNFNKKNYPYLKEILIATNGLLWSKKMWESMKGIHPYVKNAIISIDAATKETYEKNRKGGNFHDLLDNLEYIKNLPINVTLSFVVQKNNYKEMKKFVSMAKKRGFNAIFSKIVNWGTFSKKEFKDRAIHLKDHPQHRDFIKELKGISNIKNVYLSNLRDLIN